MGSRSWGRIDQTSLYGDAMAPKAKGLKTPNSGTPPEKIPKAVRETWEMLGGMEVTLASLPEIAQLKKLPMQEIAQLRKCFRQALTANPELKEITANPGREEMMLRFVLDPAPKGMMTAPEQEIPRSTAEMASRQTQHPEFQDGSPRTR